MYYIYIWVGLLILAYTNSILVGLYLRINISGNVGSMSDMRMKTDLFVIWA